MATRQELHAKLLEHTGNVYYQPPATVRMVYPCIIYDLSKVDSIYADNMAYRNMKGYEMTYISQNPSDSKIDEILESFRYIRFDRHYTADNLHHYTFSLFY